MAFDYHKFEESYKKHLGELLLPLLQQTITELCSTGGKIWSYITDLVISGVYKYVYSAYWNSHPVYMRRYGSGGLGDPENVVITITDGSIDGDTIKFGGEMINTTESGQDGGGMIENQIINGYGYKWPLPKHPYFRGDFHQPRNFYQEYEDKFDSNVAWGYVLDEIMPALPELQEAALKAALLDILK